MCLGGKQSQKHAEIYGGGNASMLTLLYNVFFPK